MLRSDQNLKVRIFQDLIKNGEVEFSKSGQKSGARIFKISKKSGSKISGQNRVGFFSRFLSQKIFKIGVKILSPKKFPKFPKNCQKLSKIGQKFDPKKWSKIDPQKKCVRESPPGKGVFLTHFVCWNRWCSRFSNFGIFWPDFF